MQLSAKSRFVTRESGLAFLPPLFSGPHEPGVRLVRPDYVYRPPVTLECLLSFERQETTRSAPIDVIDADQMRRADFPGQGTCRYPSKLVEGALVGSLARRHGLPEESFVVGNGIMSLLTTVYSTFCSARDRIVVPTPGFWPAYSFAVQRGIGVLMPEYTASEPDGMRRSFDFPREQVLQALDHRKTRLCYLCSPDNPTGTSLSEELIRELVCSHPDKLFVIDAAYWAYDHFERTSGGTIRDGLATHVAAKLVREGAPNVLGAFTFSKHYALANHRVGYLIGCPDLIDTVAYHMGPYGMSEIDLALAYYNLENDAYAEENVRSTMRNKRRIEALLTEAGQPFVSGNHNALSLEGSHWFEAFAAEQIAVRPLEYFEGIPNPLTNHIRFAVPTDHDSTEFLMAALGRLLQAR